MRKELCMRVKRAPYVCPKSPICIYAPQSSRQMQQLKVLSKEPYMYVKRALQGCQKSSTCVCTAEFETSSKPAVAVIVNKALFVYEQSTTCMSKEPYVYVKRALYMYVPQSSRRMASQRLQSLMSPNRLLSWKIFSRNY